MCVVVGSVDDGLVKGSVIMGLEGELINVGGIIKLYFRDIDLVYDVNKVFGKGEKKRFYFCKVDFLLIRKF